MRIVILFWFSLFVFNNVYAQSNFDKLDRIATQRKAEKQQAINDAINDAISNAIATTRVNTDRPPFRTEAVPNPNVYILTITGRRSYQYTTPTDRDNAKTTFVTRATSRAVATMKQKYPNGSSSFVSNYTSKITEEIKRKCSTADQVYSNNSTTQFSAKTNNQHPTTYNTANGGQRAKRPTSNGGRYGVVESPGSYSEYAQNNQEIVKAAEDKKAEENNSDTSDSTSTVETKNTTAGKNTNTMKDVAVEVKPNIKDTKSPKDSLVNYIKKGGMPAGLDEAKTVKDKTEEGVQALNNNNNEVAKSKSENAYSSGTNQKNPKQKK